MTSTQTPENIDFETLSSEDTYLVKAIVDHKIVEVEEYKDILDFSKTETQENFTEFQSLISEKNWFIVPASAFQKYEDNHIKVDELEQLTQNVHTKLNIPFNKFINSQKKVEKTDFISNTSDVEMSSDVKKLIQEDLFPQQTIEQPVKKSEPANTSPSKIIYNFEISVKNKLNELNFNKAKLEKEKNKVNLKTLLFSGGIYAAGAIFNPLSPITTPVAIGIGAYAVLKGLFNKRSDIKNYDKQIEALNEATARMVLKTHGEDTKENVKNFIKNNKHLSSALFDEKIEEEFIRICKIRNIKFDKSIFKKGEQYENSHVLEYNNNSKKAKL